MNLAYNKFRKWRGWCKLNWKLETEIIISQKIIIASDFCFSLGNFLCFFPMQFALSFLYLASDIWPYLILSKCNN